MDNPVKKEKRKWCCPDCGRDYTQEYLLYQESLDDPMPSRINNQRKVSYHD